MTATTVDPTKFQGYSVDLLRSVAGYGPSIVDDPALYAAAQAYAQTATAGGTSHLGPAILSTEPVQSISAHRPPDDILRPKKPEPVSESATWDAYDLHQLLAKVAEHGVVVNGRVKTPAKLITALEAAGVTP